MENTTDAYDSPWKESLDRYFPQFMAFFFPQAHAEIDWQKGWENLSEELRKIVRDAESRERRADRLTKVWRLDGGEQFVLLHTEIQSDHDSSFPERMFISSYRIYDRYRRPVVSLAVLGDESRTWRPEGYGWSLWGCHMRLTFPVIKLLDYNNQWSQLEADANPFALVVMAHLKTKATHGDPASRLRWKTTLVRSLYERRYERQEILELFRLLDWMLVLPDSEESLFVEELRKVESELKMPYVTAIERRGIEQGIEEGIEQGIEQGVLRGKIQLLTRQLERRFGPLPTWALDRLSQARVGDLEAWGDRILEAKSLPEVFDG